MKKIVCEICNGSEFLKKDGQFICQGCGTAYALEEVKTMMQEVAEPVVTAAAEIKAAPAETSAAAAPNQKLVNLLVMAGSALEANKLAEAEKYSNHAIELDVSCYSAWFLKGKVTARKSTADYMTLDEANKYFATALDSAPEEEKAALKEQAAQEITNVGLTLLTLSAEKFAADPNQFTLFDIKENAEKVLAAAEAMMKHGTPAEVPGFVRTGIATLMNQAGAAVLQKSRQIWKSLEHPDKQGYHKIRNRYNCADEILKLAVQWSTADEAPAIEAYKNMIAIQEDLLAMRIFKQVKKEETGEMVWVAESPLSALETTAMTMLVMKYRSTISELEAKLRERRAAEARAAEEAKQQRIKAYWEAHPEEKASLEAEIESLNEKKKQINADIAKLNGKISEIEKELSVSFSEEQESQKLKEQIKALNSTRLAAGILNFRKQKAISAEIEPLKQEKARLDAYVKAQLKRIKEEVKNKTAPLKNEISALKNSYSAAEKRQAEIRAIFTRDPAEKT